MQRIVTAFKFASVTTLLVLLFSITGNTRVQAVSTTLVINEIDYDQPSTDTAEFLELKNVSAAPINLDAYSVVFFNASTSTSYRTLDLPNVNLAAGDYYVICANAATVANCDLDGTPDTDYIQNGAPDAIGLWLGTTIIDAVSYEGDSAAPYTEGSGVGLVDNAASATEGLSRCADGADTDQNNVDFLLRTITPGATNDCPVVVGDGILVINEVDYDQPSTDTAEFLELKNVDTETANLDNYIVQLINGASGTAVVYDTIDLPAVTLAAGDHYVICANGATVANCDLDDGPDTNFIQNGNPDAIALLLNGDLVDVVSYGGNTVAPYTEGSGAGLIDPGTTGSDNLSISRCPDGLDSDQNNVDFTLQATTPGAANDCLVEDAILVINEIDYDQDGTDAAEFIELKNVGTAAGSLDNYILELVNGSGTTVYDTIDLPNVSLAAGGYYVVCANAATVANCDLDDGPDTNFIQNGAPDAVGLRLSGVLVDAVSYEGDTGAPYTEGSGAGLVDTGSVTGEGISRCPDGVDTNQNNVDFVTAAITPGAANCVVAEVAPSVDSTIPADNATNIPANSDITITFSEAVTVTDPWFTISCSTSGSHTAVVTGGPTTFTLNPDTDFTAGETCTVTIDDGQVSDQDTDDPPDNMAADYVFDFSIVTPACGNPATLISAIQGSGASSPEDGNVHTIEGVVVGDFQSVPGGNAEFNGFFLQEEDADADADPLTSEAIFVFDGASPAVDVSVGDVVRVTGTVDEFNGLTELVSVSGVELCSTGASVTPVVVSLPLPSSDFLERYENMAVTFPQELSVTETFTLGRFGEVLLSSGGRLPHPTQVQEPGAPANAQAQANDLNQILLDDGYTTQNPDPVIFPDPALSASNTLRGGDTVTDLYGVMHFAFSVYRVQPVGTVDFDHDNPRPSSPEDVGGSLKVASFNVLNYFNGDGLGGGFPTSRGAETLLEFTRQRDKIIAALTEIDADVVGLMEIENDPTPNSAIEDLVAGLNAATAPGTYDFIDTGVIGTDEIKVALIYQPGSVTPVGSFAVLDSSFDAAYIDTLNRPMLVQTFEENGSGERFTVAVNHLKSKGSDCNAQGDPDTGDEQGNCNLTRTAAAEVIVDYLATDPTGSGDSDFLIIGDLNSYAMEDPIQALEDGGYTNLLALFNGIEEYTYVFDGEWGNLDHALANGTLLPQVTGTAPYHINADEPPVLDYNTNFKSAGQIASFYAPDQYRSSDHDAVIIGLDLTTPEEPVTLYVTTETAGSVGSVSFTSHDILFYDGAAWSLFFDGSDYGLGNAHTINVIHVNAADDLYLNFEHNAVNVPGAGNIKGWEILHFDGSAFSLAFAGGNVGLNGQNERIDALHILDGSVSPIGSGCQAYYLISTVGKGKVPASGGGQLSFEGEDVLGFCATSLGSTTAGFWHIVLDGSAEGMPSDATYSLSASDDGQVLYLTTKGNFNVDSANGGHSEVYRYDVVTGEFSGPVFSVPATGLSAKVSGLHVVGDLP